MREIATCDKCGENITPNNSSRRLQELFTGQFLYTKDRHLYPVGKCEGSPSRVKLVEKDPEWWKAYRLLQKEAEAEMMP